MPVDYAPYMRLPQLETGGTNIVGTVLQGMQMRRSRRLEDIEKSRSEREEQRFKREQEGPSPKQKEQARKTQQAFQDKMSALTKALAADTPTEAQIIYDALVTGEDRPEIDFSFVGDKDDNVSITYPSGLKLTGPRAVISEATDKISKDPSWLLDKKKGQLTMAYLAGKGVSIEFPIEEAFKPTSDIGKLLKERDKLKKDDPDKKLYDASIKALLKTKGMEAVLDDEGEIVSVKQIGLPGEKKTVYLPDGKTVEHRVREGEIFDPVKVYGEGATLEKPTEKETIIKDLGSRYGKEIGRYYSAKRGVGQFVQDPNKEQVAAEALKSAKNIAIEYVKAGGDPKDLGITPEGIRDDWKAGKITEEEAKDLLIKLFKMK